MLRSWNNGMHCMSFYILISAYWCILDIEGFRFSGCECPDACNVWSYGAELSYAALSTLNVEGLLGPDTAGLSQKYHRALEINQVSEIHCNDVIMTTMASKITSLTIVYSIVYSDADQRKHQSSASLAFVRGIHRWPVNSSHKGPVTRKLFPFDDVIMRMG